MRTLPAKTIFQEPLPETVHGAGELLVDVIVNHEALIFRKGRIYSGAFGPNGYSHAHWRRPSRYANFVVRNYARRRHPEMLASGVWVIDNMSPGNYYHWTIDCLPRLLRGENLYPEFGHVLLPAHYQNDVFVTFSLRAFPRLPPHWVGIDRNVRVGRLGFVPRTPPFAECDWRSPAYDAELLRGVANRMLELTDGPGSGRRVYLSRDTAGMRRIRNEKDVVRVMREHGIEVVHLEPSRPWEQIQICSGAELIVGPHGAALSNIIFMATGGRVVEFRRDETDSRDPFYDVFRPLAESLGLTYVAQISQLAEDDQHEVINHRDLVVDLDLLRENLR